jgi:hypothetical protein
VLRSEWREPSRRLLELPLATDAPAASCLVPRDRDVDESLEEVALARVGSAPRELELLVRVEVAAGADQREAALKL